MAYDLDQAMQIFKPLPKPNLRGQLPFEALVQKNYRWEIAKTDNGVRAREFASLEIVSNLLHSAPRTKSCVAFKRSLFARL